MEKSPKLNGAHSGGIIKNVYSSHKISASPLSIAKSGKGSHVDYGAY